MPKTIRKMGGFSSKTWEPRRKREEPEGKVKKYLPSYLPIKQSILTSTPAPSA